MNSQQQHRITDVEHEKPKPFKLLHWRILPTFFFMSILPSFTLMSVLAEKSFGARAELYQRIHRMCSASFKLYLYLYLIWRNLKEKLTR